MQLYMNFRILLAKVICLDQDQFQPIESASRRSGCDLFQSNTLKFSFKKRGEGGRGGSAEVGSGCRTIASRQEETQFARLRLEDHFTD
jgi:hypothetical protein